MIQCDRVRIKSEVRKRSLLSFPISEDTDQPAHLCRLIRVFADHFKASNRSVDLTVNMSMLMVNMSETGCTYAKVSFPGRAAEILIN